MLHRFASSGVLVVALFALAAPAHADCPTHLEALPAAGFLADVARQTMEPGAKAPSPIAAQLSAAGGLSADSEAVHGTGEVAGELTAQRKGLSGCASADVLAAHDTSARVTASAELPLLLSGISFGFTLDHDVALPLSARPQYLRAPASRIAAQFSIAVIDVAITDRTSRARLLFMPFTVDSALATQDAGGIRHERQTTDIETSIMRLVASDASGTGGFDLFRIDASWIDRTTDEPSPAGAAGFVRFAPVAIESHRSDSSLVLDGGVLDLAGAVDCAKLHCARGYYNVAVGHRWHQLWLDARAERTAFVAADNTVAIEDRATSAATFAAGPRRATTTAFAAKTRPFTGGAAGNTGGAKLTLSQQLHGGFTAVVDGELARSYYGTSTDGMTPSIEKSARVLVSLAWQVAKTH